MCRCWCVSELTFGICSLFHSLSLHLLACTQAVSISGVKMYLISDVVKTFHYFDLIRGQVIFLQHVLPINLSDVIARISSSDPQIFRYIYNEFITITFQIASLLYPVTEVIDISTSFGLMLLIYIDGGVRRHLIVTEIMLQLIFLYVITL